MNVFMITVEGVVGVFPNPHRTFMSRFIFAPSSLQSRFSTVTSYSRLTFPSHKHSKEQGTIPKTAEETTSLAFAFTGSVTQTRVVYFLGGSKFGFVKAGSVSATFFHSAEVESTWSHLNMHPTSFCCEKLTNKVHPGLDFSLKSA